MICSYAVVVAFALLAPSDRATVKRSVACKTSVKSTTCYWTYGRLAFYNGTPAFRLWKIGTHRLLGVYSGPSVDLNDDHLDNEHPDLPADVLDTVRPIENWIIGDFEVCPLEPAQPGAMQAVCIESAKNLRAIR
jgi:hypothetical protein